MKALFIISTDDAENEISQCRCKKGRRGQCIYAGERRSI